MVPVHPSNKGAGWKQECWVSCAICTSPQTIPTMFHQSEDSKVKKWAVQPQLLSQVWG